MFSAQNCQKNKSIQPVGRKNNVLIKKSVVSLSFYGFSAPDTVLLLSRWAFLLSCSHRCPLRSGH